MTDTAKRNVYMADGDYDSLQAGADALNNMESALTELRERFHALYPDNSYSVNQEDFEEAVNYFESQQKIVIKEMDKLIP